MTKAHPGRCRPRSARTVRHHRSHRRLSPRRTGRVAPDPSPA